MSDVYCVSMWVMLSQAKIYAVKITAYMFEFYQPSWLDLGY